MNLKVCEALDLKVGYDKRFPILENINFTIEQRKKYALVGSNGSGKTTLIKTIAGIIPAIDGKLEYKKGAKISIVPQSKKINFLFPITVEKLLKMGMEVDIPIYKKYHFNEDEKNILKILGVEDILKLTLRKCSGGQLQRAFLARTLLLKPDLAIFDEPLDALDPSSRKKLIEIIKEKISDTSILVITHNIESDWLKEFNQVLEVVNKKVIILK
ncbi:MAG: ATP-binding cassette domain-containing protein [Leptospiraceae bacterium]|nr:ATP-binding cassette domain-containing protein [Leptospiraceae bacterium]